MLESEGSMAAERAVLFDLGNVLIGWEPRALFSKVIADRARLDYFLEEVCSSGWNHSIDAGKPFLQAVRERQAEMPEYAEYIAMWYDRWDEMVPGALAGTVEILRELKARGTRLYALTNWSKETFPLARARFDFLGWFRDIVVSGDELMAKPDPAFYQLAARRCGLVPERTVFIDDMPVNVEAACALGFDGIRFTGAEPLRAALLERGLLGA
jgi:2-haloacid dehalogenase